MKLSMSSAIQIVVTAMLDPDPSIRFSSILVLHINTLDLPSGCTRTRAPRCHCGLIKLSRDMISDASNLIDSHNFQAQEIILLCGRHKVQKTTLQARPLWHACYSALQTRCRLTGCTSTSRIPSQQNYKHTDCSVDDEFQVNLTTYTSF